MERVLLVCFGLAHYTHPPVPVEAEKSCHLFLSQFKVKDLEVFHNALWCDRLGDHNHISLNLEAKENLCCSFVVLGCNLFNLGVIQKRRILWLSPWSVRRAKGAICCHSNPFGLTIVNQLLLGQIWMTFNLVVCRLVFQSWLIQNSFNLLIVEVGDANGFYQASIHQLFHGLPYL